MRHYFELAAILFSKFAARSGRTWIVYVSGGQENVTHCPSSCAEMEWKLFE